MNIYKTFILVALGIAFIATFPTVVQAADELVFDFYLGKDDFTSGHGQGEFHMPMKVAVDSRGYIYVVDYGNVRVQIFDENGNYLRQMSHYTYDTEYGKHTSYLYPVAIDLDEHDQVYALHYNLIAYDQPHRNSAHIVVYDMHGDYIEHWGSYGTEKGQFIDPYDLAVDRDGYIYVADAGNRRIQKFNASFEYVTDWSVSGNPVGIDVDRHGNVYVVDTSNHRVLKYDEVGNLLTQWGSKRGQVQKPGEFSLPRGIAVDNHGDIYVTDNYWLQKFDSEGRSLGYWGADEGELSKKLGEFSRPDGVAVGPEGTVYVVEWQSHRLQAFQPLPSDADLDGLVLSDGVLSPVFHPNTMDYKVKVPYAVSQISVTPHVADMNAIVTVNGVETEHGMASHPIPLAVGVNDDIEIEVTGTSGMVKIYRIQVNRAESDIADLRELSLDKGQLVPEFQKDILEYSVHLNYEERGFTVTAATYDPDASIAVHSINFRGNEVSQYLMLQAGETDIHIVVKAPDGVNTKTYTIRFHVATSTDATLIGLLPSVGDFVPEFDPEKTNYTLSVPYKTESIRFKPTLAHGGASLLMRVGDGVPIGVTDNDYTDELALNVGDNNFEFLITAADGLTENIYRITVTRAKSDNANIRNLTLDGVALNRPVEGDVSHYFATVSNEVSETTITPIPDDEDAVVTVNGVEVASGEASPVIPFIVGENIITIVVTAADGTTNKTYTIQITRTPSTNADLRALAFSEGVSLHPEFVANETTYVAKVDHTVESVTVTPEVDEPNATVAINGVTVESGKQSVPLPLNIGKNEIHITVTAQSGVEKTYTVTITRLLPGSGTEEDPFLITDRAGLEFIRIDLGAHYRLEADLDLSGAVWEPIEGIFTGVLDGNGHAMTNLTIQKDVPSDLYNSDIGLFEMIDGTDLKGAPSVKNLTFSHVTTTGISHVAVLAGWIQFATIEAVNFYDAKIYGSHGAGALAGFALTVTAKHIYADVAIQELDGSALNKAGGIIGSGVMVQLSESYATGVLKGDNDLGGLVGELMFESQLENTYAEVTISGIENVGGLVGNWLEFDFESSLSTSYAVGLVNGEAFVGGLVGQVIEVDVYDSYYLQPDGSVYDTLFGTPKSAEQLSDATTFALWDSALWSMHPGPYPRLRVFLSDDDTLKQLSMSAGALVPLFSPHILNYAVTVTHAVYETTVTPMLSDPKATLKINGRATANGTRSFAIPLEVGSNTIEIEVTAEEGNQRVYTVEVNRLASDEARLNQLYSNEVVWQEDFAPNRTTYTATVTHDVDGLTVVPVTMEETATVQVNGLSVQSGDPSPWFDLQVGLNTITVEVTAQNGDVLIYTITVIREPDPPKEDEDDDDDQSNDEDQGNDDDQSNDDDQGHEDDQDHEDDRANEDDQGNEEDQDQETTVPVLLNGEEQETMFDVTTYERDGREGTMITIRPDALMALLQQIDQASTISVAVLQDAEETIFVWHGQLVKQLEQQQAKVEVSTPTARYTIDAADVNIDAIAAQLGADRLEDIRIEIDISHSSEEAVQAFTNLAMESDLTVVFPPLHFEIRAVYGDQSVEVATFTNYVERAIRLPEDTDPTQISTGVVIDHDGAIRHVPTKIIVVDGTYYAVIQSLTNSAYSLIWHPVTFQDMEGHWAEATVHNMGSRLIINGMPDGSFQPNREITRAEFAALVTKGLGLKSPVVETMFTDVRPTAWYSGPVQTAYEYELINGYEDGTFRPLDTIDREQAVMIIARAMRLTGLQLDTSATSGAVLQSFSDTQHVSKWALPGMTAAVQAGLLHGKDDHKLAPQASLTRAEAAVLIERLLQKSGLID